MRRSSHRVQSVDTDNSTSGGKNYIADTKRSLEFAAEKGASSWLAVIPISEMNFNLNKREFRDALNLRYDWNISESPSMCVYGETFTIDHAETSSFNATMN